MNDSDLSMPVDIKTERTLRRSNTYTASWEMFGHQSSISSTSLDSGSDLLVDWPVSDSSDGGGMMGLKKEVTFSKYSEVHLYKRDKRYQVNKSYSSADRKSFQIEAAQEGIRIQDLIKTSGSIGKLLESRVLTRAELIGIEPLVTKKGAVRMMYERRYHSALVLRAQEELREKNVNGNKAEKMLADVSVRSSSKSSQNAKLRAALAS
jgi:hypothetical protein